VIFIIQKLG